MACNRRPPSASNRKQLLPVSSARVLRAYRLTGPSSALETLFLIYPPPEQPLDAICLNCRAIIGESDEKHKSCKKRLFQSLVDDARDEQDAWLQFRSKLPHLIETQCSRADNAAEAAIEAVAKVIRAKAEDIKKDVRGSCSDSDVSLALQNHAEHLEHLTKAIHPPEAGNFDSSFNTLLESATHIPHPPPTDCGIVYPATAEVASLAKLMFIGRVLGGLGDKQVIPLNKNAFQFNHANVLILANAAAGRSCPPPPRTTQPARSGTRRT